MGGSLIGILNLLGIPLSQAASTCSGCPSIAAMIFNHHLARKPATHCTSAKHLSQWHGNCQVKSRIDSIMSLTSQPMSQLPPRMGSEMRHQSQVFVRVAAEALAADASHQTSPRRTVATVSHGVPQANRSCCGNC